MITKSSDLPGKKPNYTDFLNTIYKRENKFLRISVSVKFICIHLDGLRKLGFNFQHLL